MEVGSIMIEISKYCDETKELYNMWQTVSQDIPYTEKMDRATFKSAYLDNALAENICYLAREDGKLKGAAMIHIYSGWGAVLQLWYPHYELGDEASIKLLKKSIELCKELKTPKISPKPLLGCPRYYEFFTSHNFTKDEEYPEGLWMQKELKEIPNFQMPEGLNITFTEDLEENGIIEKLAHLEIDIAQEQHNLKVKLDENIQALRTEMQEENVVYGIAKINSLIVGYSRTIFADLLSGEKIAKNRGLAVNENYRNKRIGEALLISSMTMVKDKDYDKMFISTHSKNPAQHLYKRVGFEIIEIVPSLIYKLGLN
jgi:ribosomal protein S18 acetylase RimI-like enzyme